MKEFDVVVVVDDFFDNVVIGDYVDVWYFEDFVYFSLFLFDFVNCWVEKVGYGGFEFVDEFVDYCVSVNFD